MSLRHATLHLRDLVGHMSPVVLAAILILVSINLLLLGVYDRKDSSEDGLSPE